MRKNLMLRRDLERLCQEIAKNLYKKELRALTPKEWEFVLAEVLKHKAFSAMLEVSKKKKKNVSKSSQRIVVYNTIECLPGRLVTNALNNLGIYQDIVEIMHKNGMNPNMFEKIPDAALGNGGLGRLAADFAEAATSVGYPVVINGLLYWKGLHRQEFGKDSYYPINQPDDWANGGQPWLKAVREDEVIVNLGTMGQVKAVPMQMTVYGNRKFSKNYIDLPAVFWLVEPMTGENNEEFAYQMCEYLYPDDSTEHGKLLRLAQERVFTDAMVQRVLKYHKKLYGNLGDIEKQWAFQMNDTHPVVGCLSFIYYLMKEGYSFEDAFQKAKKCWFYTNHTIMPEALEKWPRHLFRQIAPHLEKIVEQINQRLLEELTQDFKALFVKSNADPDWEKIHPYEMFDQNGNVMMSNIACYVAGTINGVANVHSEIIKKKTLGQWGAIYPQRFTNVTNGVHPGSWVMSDNLELTAFLNKYAGKNWCSDMGLLEKLIQRRNNPKVLDELAAAKKSAKKRLLAKIAATEGVQLDAEFFIVTQVKRIHEYKRQSMNILAILRIYEQLKAGELPNFHKTAFLFGGKAAASYQVANETVAFIRNVADLINNDPQVNNRLRVVFLTNFDVSYAKLVYAGSDLSVQISQAGTEASGTSNMKFMMNGAVTIGTRDGANIEIAGLVGDRYEYMFGASVWEFRRIEDLYNHTTSTAQNIEFMNLLDYMNGAGGIGTPYHNLADSLKTGDHYKVFYDLPEYYDTLLKAIMDYGEEQRTGERTFTQKALMNIAWSGYFSAVRSIHEYAEKIWGIGPVKKTS